MLLLLPVGVIVANAQDAPLQSRYVVQPGDSLESVAWEFGVDPAAILAASAIDEPPITRARRDHHHPGPERISRSCRLEREPAGGGKPVRGRRP